nr:hypothetical protein [uncultured Oscillibacter sp.]
MEHSTFKELYAQTIGMEVLKSLSGEDVLEALARKADAEAFQVLSEIRAILNDENLDDPARFRRIDAIVETFYRHGISTTRHDF